MLSYLKQRINMFICDVFGHDLRFGRKSVICCRCWIVHKTANSKRKVPYGR